jgi:hypothetical protein
MNEGIKPRRGGQNIYKELMIQEYLNKPSIEGYHLLGYDAV